MNVISRMGILTIIVWKNIYYALQCICALAFLNPVCIIVTPVSNHSLQYCQHTCILSEEIYIRTSHAMSDNNLNLSPENHSSTMYSTNILGLSAFGLHYIVFELQYLMTIWVFWVSSRIYPLVPQEFYVSL